MIHKWIHAHVPLGYRRHPMGMSFLILWGALGFSTVQHQTDGKPWPDLLWPTTMPSLQLGTPGHTAMHITGYLMIACSLIVLSSHPLAHKYRKAAFVRWAGLWVGAVTAGLIALAIVAARFIHSEDMLPLWPASLAFWLLIVFMFGLSLRIANCAYKANFVLEPEMIVIQRLKNPSPM